MVATLAFAWRTLRFKESSLGFMSHNAKAALDSLYKCCMCVLLVCVHFTVQPWIHQKRSSSSLGLIDSTLGFIQTLSGFIFLYAFLKGNAWLLPYCVYDLFSETDQPKPANSAHLVWLGQTKEQQAERPRQHRFYERAQIVSWCPLLKSQTL